MIESMSGAQSIMDRGREWPGAVGRRRWPLTLWVGIVWVVACEALLFGDVIASHRGALRSQGAIVEVMAREPTSGMGRLARWAAVNMTPLVWPGYVILMEGILVAQTGSSPVRRRPHHFALLCLASIFIWCVFDWINFYYIRAWDYIGMPQENRWSRYWGYASAFACVVPGMLLSGQFFMNLGWFDGARSPGWRMPRWAKWVALSCGAAMLVWPFIGRNPVTNLTLWTSLVFFLDPINLKLGRPGMFRDWQAGWYGRTLAAFAGGLLCGLLWEFWNYWALAKWVYHLPFLGAAQEVRYFEMPVIGLLGFIPFGLECWVMWQTMRMPLDGLAEGLPDERTLV
ncbi:MAG: hypothetical protein JWO87_1300 [Phycisphaerales bacterium]|nr:hypothetical protein [Phycisphaerales bacterium]